MREKKMQNAKCKVQSAKCSTWRKQFSFCTLHFAFCILLVSWLAAANTARADTSFADIIAGVQPRIVKIYGAGGLRGLEAYQSGFLISAEGHILTVWSYVLDTEEIQVTLNDGRHASGNEHHPEKIGVALDAITGIPDEAEAVEQVGRVAERDERVVLDEAMVPGQRQARGDQPQQRELRAARREGVRHCAASIPAAVRMRGP